MVDLKFGANTDRHFLKTMKSYSGVPKMCISVENQIRHNTLSYA